MIVVIVKLLSFILFLVLFLFHTFKKKKKMSLFLHKHPIMLLFSFFNISEKNVILETNLNKNVVANNQAAFVCLYVCKYFVYMEINDDFIIWVIQCSILYIT